MNIVAMEIYQLLNSLKYNQNSIDTNNIYNDHYSQEYNPHFSYFTNKDDDALLNLRLECILISPYLWLSRIFVYAMSPQKIRL